jgi:hypothetical protein
MNTRKVPEKIVKKPGLRNLMWEAVKAEDEEKIKELILQAMELFLQGKIPKYALDDLGSTYIVVPIHEKGHVQMEFENKKLGYVLDKLSAIEVVDDERAVLDVKRYIAYLKGEDYENVN